MYRLHIRIVWIFIIIVSTLVNGVTANETITTPSLSAVEKAIERAAGYNLTRWRAMGYR